MPSPPCVLFYEDPVTDGHRFMWRLPHITLDAPMYQTLKNGGWPCRVLLNTHFSDWAVRQGVAKEDLVLVDEKAWIALLDDPHEDINTLFYKYLNVLEGNAAKNPGDLHEQIAIKENHRRQRAISEVLRDFKPDIIITWVPSPFLRQLFPDALILHRESGIFTRSPYPMTYFLDPCGLHQWAWPARYNGTNTDRSAHNLVDKLRETFLSLFKIIEPFPSLIEELASFRKSILVTTQVSGHYSFDGTCNYRSQMHLLLDVLENAPPDCAVLLGQHPDYANKLRPGEIAWLKGRFPNFIHYPEFVGQEGISQHLLCHADAVVSISSTVGWHAAVYGKSIVALGKSQLNALADADEAASVGRILETGPPDRRAEAAWLIFHYCIPATYFAKRDWLISYLEGKLHHWIGRGAEGYYDQPFAAPDEIANIYTDKAQILFHEILGKPFGETEMAEDLDFRDNRYFRQGWSYCEEAGDATYRWIEGIKAWLFLPFIQRRSIAIEMVVATHAGCKNQKITIGIGEAVLATAEVPVEKQVKLEFVLRSEMLALPLTKLWVKAAQAEQPLGDERRLSLICQRLSLKG